MALVPGTRLGSYEVTGAIGAGGMGEVYRARDTKLGREVALKVLPEEFASDAERMARFEREAKLLASLNHSNIASIYGFEDSGGVHALAMELVEGPTLADLVAKGPIPIDEALPIAKQIAEGLEYAHERGIVHRDLKPANVKITPDGAVKILDFGLAKALAGDGAATSDPSTSPTLSHLATQAGIILGTAAYMAPEQAKGKAVDRRADIWAFGCVLFEMLAAKQTFNGEAGSEILAAVIKEEPNWAALPSLTPRRIRELIRRCLQKDAKQRLQAIGDARIAIDEVLIGGRGTEEGSQTVARASRWARVLPWAIVAVALLAAAIAYLRPTRAPEQEVLVAQIAPPPNTVFTVYHNFSGTPTLSPNGQQLAFVAAGPDGRQRIWVRLLNSAAAQPLEGTDGAEFPFWSPDNKSIGFFANGKLNRYDLSSGSLLTLADAPSGNGASWGPDGTILFAPTPNGSLFRVSASGGTLRPVTRLSQSRKDFAHRWPQFLPDGKHFLFYVWSAVAENSGVYVGSLEGTGQKLVLRNPSGAVYVSPDHLLFVRQGTLMAMRFDPASLRLSGDMTPVIEHIAPGLGFYPGPLTASENGILVYAGEAAAFTPMHLYWFDRTGKQIGETGTPTYYDTPRISPDGNKLAVEIDELQNPDSIWVFDLRGDMKRRLNFSNSFNVAPVWSPDGKTLAFLSNRNGGTRLFQKPADGTGRTSPLFADKRLESTVDSVTWTDDNRYLVFGRRTLQVGSSGEIWALPLFGDRKPILLVRGAQQTLGQFAVSPDGRWLAYVSGDSGQHAVEAVPFPHGSGKWQISTGQGSAPRWRRDGKELFYLSPDGEIMSAELVEQGASLVVRKVQPLFRANPVPSPGWNYDVTPDGQKFVVVQQEQQKVPQPLTLVVNWPALLKRQ